MPTCPAFAERRVNPHLRVSPNDCLRYEVPNERATEKTFDRLGRSSSMALGINELHCLLDTSPTGGRISAASADGASTRSGPNRSSLCWWDDDVSGGDRSETARSRAPAPEGRAGGRPSPPALLSRHEPRAPLSI